jgi:uncharacterized sporulation protein YeaH/YhbH (DUF444 family)
MQILDRRLNPSGKNLANHQRFMRRAKALVKEAVRNASKGRDIPDILEGGEVSIPAGGVGEPRLRHGPGGVRDDVLPGNRKFAEGDVIPRPPGGGGGGGSGGSGEGEGEDAFRFVLSRDEFIDLFLDDLELPDLAKRRLAEVEHQGIRRAGYAVAGSPTNIALGRTMRLAMARRVALGRPNAEAVDRLEAQIAGCDDDTLRTTLRAEIVALEAKMRRVPYIDPIDIRYRRFENEPRPVAKAVMFCLMDVSGSMSEHMKDLAKRFYMLLYIFLNRRYKHVDIVFIRHTDRAEEVDEDTFFHGPATGGTVVSSAFEAMRAIVAQRYDPEIWNIYAAQASDGDNSYGDGEKTMRLLRDAILPITQYFAYLEVSEASHSGTGFASSSSLWRSYDRLRGEGQPLSMRKVGSRSEIFQVFRDLFQRQPSKDRAVP